MQEKKKIYPEFAIREESQHGVRGLYERLLRRHKKTIHALTLLPVYGLATLILSISLTPSILFFQYLQSLALEPSLLLKAFLIALGIGGGFFIFGFTLILVVPLMNTIILPWVKPGRGQDYSTRFVGWYVHNAFTYLVRYTFLEFITPTPFNLLFFRLMGMKIGRDVVINSSNISDPSLITLEDGVTIGGSAVILGHYGMGGFLVVSPVTIRKGATIGLHAKIFGGVEIGEDVKILPNSVVMPKTRIPAGETWGGSPAVKWVSI